MNDGNMYLEIARVVAAEPGRTAIECGDRQISYGELDAAVARTANALLDTGVRPGDRVAVQVQKSISSLFVYLACLRAGLVYLPLNTAYQSSELDYFLRDAEPGLVLVEPEKLAAMKALSDASTGASVMTLEGNDETALRKTHCCGSGAIRHPPVQ